MTYFCPVRWAEISGDTLTCPRCAADLISEDAKPLLEKLLAALN